MKGSKLRAESWATHRMTQAPNGTRNPAPVIIQTLIIEDLVESVLFLLCHHLLQTPETQMVGNPQSRRVVVNVSHIGWISLWIWRHDVASYKKLRLDQKVSLSKVQVQLKSAGKVSSVWSLVHVLFLSHTRLWRFWERAYLFVLDGSLWPLLSHSNMISSLFQRMMAFLSLEHGHKFKSHYLDTDKSGFSSMETCKKNPTWVQYMQIYFQVRQHLEIHYRAVCLNFCAGVTHTQTHRHIHSHIINRRFNHSMKLQPYQWHIRRHQW